ncbi:MAG TPA: ABC transporter permease [Anaerolineaceae bacterium]
MDTYSSQLLAPEHAAFGDRVLGNLRALGAVSKKEWLYFVRYPSWFVNMIIWPTIFPLAYILSARALSGPDGSGLAVFTSRTGIKDYMGFIAIGTTVWMWQNVVLWGVGFALRNEQMHGTLESNWMTPTWRFTFLLGPSAIHFVNMIVFIIISAVEFGLFFGVRFHGNPLLVALLVLLSMPSVYGLGMAFASLVITAKEAHNFVFMVRGLVMIFCGVTFPISILPGWMQVVATWLPQTYMMHGIRITALANASFQDLAPDLVALVGFGAFWLAAGYVIFNWMERRARQTGAIGQY